MKVDTGIETEIIKKYGVSLHVLPELAKLMGGESKFDKLSKPNKMIVYFTAVLE